MVSSFTRKNGVLVKKQSIVECVKDDGEKYYYGIIKEIMQVEYSREPTKQLVVFNCEWFDNTINHGIKVQPQYGIVEVNFHRRYSNFDPFIFATNAIQVTLS